MNEIRTKTRGASGRTRLMKTAVSAALVLLLATMLVTGAASAAEFTVTTEADLIEKLVNGNTVKLGGNIQLTDQITLSSGTMTLDLNGKNLTAKKDKRLFNIGGASFTLTDSKDSGFLVGNGTVTGSGGGVSIESGIFTMNGGSIIGCSPTSAGGGVYIYGGVPGGRFIMNGGSITNCRAQNGGAVDVNGGTFTMNGGNITKCTATSLGGGVHVNGDTLKAGSGTFTMNGGNIISCTAVCGGGANVGGDMYSGGGKFTMTGGSITGCTASGGHSFGGGVHVILGPFTMSGGSISGCSAIDSGGGVAVLGTAGGSFAMSGGSISGCSASHGGGIIVLGDSTFTISGTALVAENNDVTLQSPGYTYIVCGGAFESGDYGVKNITLYDTANKLNAAAWIDQTVVMDSTDTSKFKLSSLHTGFTLNDSGSNSLTVTALPPVPPVVPSSEYHNLGEGIWCIYDEERNIYTLLPEAAIPSSAYIPNPFAVTADGSLTVPTISVGSLPASAYNVTFLGWRNEDVKIIEVQPGISLADGSGVFAAFPNAELSYFGDGTEPARDVFGADRLLYKVTAVNSSEILPNGHYTGRAMTLETDWAVAGQKVKIAVIPENGYAVYDWKLHKGDTKTGDLLTPVENYIERINDPDYGSTIYVLTMPASDVTVEPVLRDQGTTIIVYLFIDADSYVLEIPADFNIKKQDLPVTDKMVNLTACDMLPGHVLNVNMTSEGGYTNLGLPGFSGSTFVMSNIRSSADKAGYTIAKKQIYKGETGFTQITSNGNIVLSTQGFDAEALDDKITAGEMKTELEFTMKGVTNQNALGKYKDKLTFTVEIES